MFKFRDLKLSTKLFLIAILPVALLGYISFDKISEEIDAKDKLEHFSVKLDELELLENVTHEIQQERDLGALFLIDATLEAQMNLQNQWKESDSLITIYKSFVYQNQLDTTLFELFSSLQQRRANVTYFQYESTELEFLYNVQIESFLAHVSKVEEDLMYEKSLANYNAHISLLWTKEYLGRIRSNLNTLFTLGGFGDLNYGIFAVNKGGFESNLNNFRKTADESILNEYESNFLVTSGRMLQTIDYVFEHPELKNFPFEKSSWWLTATTAINNLNQIASYSITEMKGDIRLAIKDSETTIWQMWLFLSSTIIVVVLFCVYVINSLTKQVREIQRASRKIITGDTEILVPVRTNDAIGSLAESFNSLVQNSRKLASIADKIGKGDYEVDVPVRSGKDKLGKSLEEMRSNLLRTNTQLIVKAKELEENNIQIRQQNEELIVAREALHQTVEELESANRYKSEFLANISHELRTPLNSILILTKILESNKESNLTEDQIHSLNVIDKSGTDLLILINDILDLSKIEAGKIDLNISAINLHESLNNVVELFDPLAKDKQIGFKFENHINQDQIVRLDRLRFEQILKNLLSNAFKFTPQNGMVKLQATGDENSFTVKVVDTGIGIPLDKQESIFEAFKQVDGTTTRKYGGTGLGLTITKQLVEMMDGEIDIESQEGAGTTFSIKFNQEVLGDIKEDEDEVFEMDQTQDQLEPLIIQDVEEVNIHFNGQKFLYVEEDITKVFELSAAFNAYDISIVEVDQWNELVAMNAREFPTAIIINLDYVDLNEVSNLQVLEQIGKPVLVINKEPILFRDTKFKVFPLGYPVKVSKIVEVLKTLSK